MLNVSLIPILKDNYVFYAEDSATGANAIIDPGHADPVIDFLQTNHVTKLDYILNTHHHGDHISGNAALVKEFGAKIIAPASEKHRIPDIDVAVEEGDTVSIGSQEARVIEVPGHTTGHIVYHFADSHVLFVGDTIFVMGCGRLFEGTPAQMWNSLLKLRALPDETIIYCAHEYTEQNMAVCKSVDTENTALFKRIPEIQEARKKGLPTVPTMMGLEKKTNVFLRADDNDLASTLGLSDTNPVQIFAELRSRKDNF